MTMKRQFKIVIPIVIPLIVFHFGFAVGASVTKLKIHLDMKIRIKTLTELICKFREDDDMPNFWRLLDEFLQNPHLLYDQSDRVQSEYLKWTTKWNHRANGFPENHVFSGSDFVDSVGMEK